MRVKICGLTREEDVQASIDAGADALGFICGFPESPRNIGASRARELIRSVPPFVDSVLVTRSEFLEEDPAMLRRLMPSAVQLYGTGVGALKFVRSLGVKLILPCFVDADGDGLVDARGFDAVLSDTARRGLAGGTGEVSDWRLCRRLKDAVAPTPFVLSGGLNQRNVGDAILRVDPYAVDVSSGVEKAPGIKDRVKMEAFVRAAKGGG